MSSAWRTVVGTLLIGAAGCDPDAAASEERDFAPRQPPDSVGSAADVLTASPPPLASWAYWQRRHYVAVPDVRTCDPPACGGYFVRMVNADTTTCWDGFGAPECYVTGIDLEGTLLPEETQKRVLAAVDARTDWRHVTVVLRGGIGPSEAEGLGRLVVDAAWHGEPVDPEYPAHGTRYYQVIDDKPSTIVRRVGVGEPEHAVVGVADPLPLDLIVAGLRDEELLDVDARFVRVR